MGGIHDEPTRRCHGAARGKGGNSTPSLEGEDDNRSRGNNFKDKPSFFTSILAGGIAGVVVDISLYPLDTMKTRLQSKEGFTRSGGLKGIYNGVLPVLLGSAPLSALFFATYNALVNSFKTENSYLNSLVYVVSASCAEVVSATVRVPIEIVKQRNQVIPGKCSQIIKKTFKSEGFPGFYRGFSSTLLREIPFAAVQFSLWEHLTNQIIIYQNVKELTAFQIAYCGAIAGAVAATVTTPMDVIKTRIMLAEKEKINKYKKNLNYYMAREIFMDRGIFGLFAGLVPRVLWIMLGGFIYFGAYEEAKLICEGNKDIFKYNIVNFWDFASKYLKNNAEAFENFNNCEKKKVVENNSDTEKQIFKEIAILNPPETSKKKNNCF